MLFQVYINNIKIETWKMPIEFKKLAEEKGFITKGKLTGEIKAEQKITWLKNYFALVHVHAMAIYTGIKEWTK